MTNRSLRFRLTSAAVIGAALFAAASPSVQAQQAPTGATQSTGTGNRGLVLQPTSPNSTPPSSSTIAGGGDGSNTAYGGLVQTPSSPSGGTTSSSGAYGGLVTSPNSSSNGAMGGLSVTVTPGATITHTTPTSPGGMSPAEAAAYQAAQNTIDDNVNLTVDSKPEVVASALALQMAVPQLNSNNANVNSNTVAMSEADRTAMNLSGAIGAAQTDLATATYTYLKTVAAVQLQNNGFPNAAAKMTEGYAANDTGLQLAKAQLDQAQQAYDAAWGNYTGQTGITHDQVINYDTETYGNVSSDRSNEYSYPQKNVTGWRVAVDTATMNPQDAAAYAAAQQQINDAYAAVANAPPDVQLAAMRQAQANVNAQFGNSTRTFSVGPNVAPEGANATAPTTTSQAAQTTAYGGADAGSPAAQAAEVAALAAAAAAADSAAAAAEQAADAAINISVSSSDGSSSTMTPAAAANQLQSQADILEAQAQSQMAAGQALSNDPATAMAGAAQIAAALALQVQANTLRQQATIDQMPTQLVEGEPVIPSGDDNVPLTSDEIEATAADYEMTGDDTLSVAKVASIYTGYSVNQPGSSVIQVPSTQVATPSSVMTAPSTQVQTPSSMINMPSTQVQTPSDVMTTPSLQINFPSEQIDIPSDVMTGLDLQVALCGR